MRKLDSLSGLISPLIDIVNNIDHDLNDIHLLRAILLLAYHLDAGDNKRKKEMFRQCLEKTAKLYISKVDLAKEIKI